MNFDLEQQERKATWNYTISTLEDFYENTEQYRAAIFPTRDDVKKSIENNFDTSRSTVDAVKEVVDGLSKYAVHTPHPNYYGMFNPRANFPSILADAITATFNPQLAAWGHAQYAVEIENLLIQELGKKFGYEAPNIDGVFATGGQEANLTAVLSALNHKFPKFGQDGLQSIEGKPVLYCSKASHHSGVKAAKVSGLGSNAVRYIDVNAKQEMRVDLLKEQIVKDLKDGCIPFMIVATMGSTGVGAIDPIIELANISKENNLWLHADAAYGGAVVLTENYKYLFKGLELADSVTFDAHKWLSVPMATSLYITKHPNILGKTFSITSDYMPEEEDEIERLGSYTHSIQWSRRFMGLKLYMPLLVFGWKGYDDTISHQIKMGKLLRQKLQENNWQLYNSTELPIVCFNDPDYEKNEHFTSFMYDSFLETGEAWINKFPIDDTFTLRACITNYATTEKHLDELIALLNKKRSTYSTS